MAGSPGGQLVAGAGQPLSEQLLPQGAQLVGVGEAVDGRLVGGVVDAAVALETAAIAAPGQHISRLKINAETVFVSTDECWVRFKSHT